MLRVFKGLNLVCFLPHILVKSRLDNTSILVYTTACQEEILNISENNNANTAQGELK